MAFPRQLNLVKGKEEYYITSNPVDEIERLRESKMTIKPFVTKDKTELTKDIPFALSPVEVIADFTLPKTGAASEFGFELYNSKGENILIGYSEPLKKFIINRKNAGKSD